MAPRQLPADLTSKAPRRETNATAEDLSRAALPLGIDLNADDADAAHPTASDVEAFTGTGVRGWLSSQLEVSDDSIAREPAILRDFLESRRDALWKVVAVLEKGRPKWPSSDRGRIGPPPRLLAILRLNSLLLSAALIEERGGRSIEAGRLLEASWTLYRSLTDEASRVSAIVAVFVMKLQVGVLRKVREPQVEWPNRLSGDNPWQQTLDAFENEPHALASADPALALDALSNSFANVDARGYRAAAEALRLISPCDLDDLSAEEIGRPMAEEYRKANDPGNDSSRIAQIFTEMIVPGLKSQLARSGRLAVESQLTLKILELRLSRSSARDRRWPERLEDDFSNVCPGAAYFYRRDGSGMEIEFKGTAPAVEGGLTLPLSFSTRADRRPTPPAPPVTPTPTPAPAPDPN